MTNASDTHEPPVAILEAALYVDDLDAAEAFYRDVLGFEPFAKVVGRHLFYRCANQILLLFDPKATREVSTVGIPVPPHGAVGSGHVCFRADAQGIEDWRRRLTSAGIEIEMDFEWPQGGRSIYFRDPSGNSLEFAEPRIWGFEN